VCTKGGGELILEKETIGFLSIAIVSIVAITGVMLLEPIPQDIHYHLFADQRIIFGIPNFWNVASNVPFLLVGCMGLYSIFYSSRIRLIAELKSAYILIFLGIALIAFGSGYYHLWPSNMSLLWDRLPMTIFFMSLFSAIIGEFISPNLGQRVTWPLVALGIFSVIYWYVTEQNDAGDLRLYALIQFLPLLLVPLILVFFKSPFTHSSAYWLLISAYAVAKGFEYFDAAVFNVHQMLSGHSLKHVVAALGLFFLLRGYTNRKRSSQLQK
jgi:hypothetical protein